MSNFLTKFFGFVLHIKAKVSDVMIQIFGPQVASEIGHAALSALTQNKLGTAILEYVTELTGPQYQNLTGDIKRLQVVSKAQVFAAANGFAVPDSLINTLIEFAVGKVKGFYDAAGPHDPAVPPAPLPPAPVSAPAPAPDAAVSPQ